MVQGFLKRRKDEDKKGIMPYEQTKHERMEKYKCYKEIAQRAIESGKIFRIIGTMDITKIRLELKQRGYIETVPHSWNNKYFQMSNHELLDLAEPGNHYEQALLSKMVEGYMPNYLWVSQPRLYGIHKNVPYMNKIHIDEYYDWGFKDGMLKCMKEVSRICGDEIVRNHYSRGYVMTGFEDIEEFNQDYRFTMAVSFIRFILSQNDPKEIFSSNHGKVKSNVIDFALNIIHNFINLHKTGSKTKINFDDDLTESRWQQLKTSHILLLKRKEKIRESSDEKIEHQLFRMQIFLAEVLAIWPERKYDGHNNMWLLKPTYMGEGCGIVITDNDLSINEVVTAKHNSKYIVQKYIERPMLIYKTKFDFRQYFLVQIDDNHLRVWSSPMSSVKFASCEYNLKCFHEAIHITNTAVQMKYKNQTNNPLPSDHLWSIHDFTNYLAHKGDRFLWRDYIYPQMNKVIVEIVKGSMDFIDKKSGRFELFGCDWLLTEDYKPILLEINRPPSLEYYSPVSGIVCGTIMEDLIKVTVDLPRNSYAYTGSFEEIYKEEISPSRSNTTTPVTRPIQKSPLPNINQKTKTEAKKTLKDSIHKEKSIQKESNVTDKSVTRQLVEIIREELKIKQVKQKVDDLTKIQQKLNKILLQKRIEMLESTPNEIVIGK